MSSTFKPIRLAVLAALALVMLWPSAQAGKGFTWYVSEVVVYGKEKPTFTLIPPMDLTRVVLKVQDDTGRVIAEQTGPVAAGQKSEIRWTQPPGARAYTGVLAFYVGADEYTLNLSFKMVVGTPPVLDVPLDLINDAAHTLVVKSSQPAGGAEVTVVGEGGSELAHFVSELKGEAPGTPLTLSWGPAAGTPLRVDIKVTDLNGFPGGYTIYPWSYAVPHEEIVFESGKSEVRASELPKLEATWQEIQQVLTRYGDVVQMSLYVAGYTDTVDDAAYNQGLSEARAKAIAAQFKALGFERPIFYQGFGERVLAVQTGDGEAMEANRRAVYVLSAQAPRDRDQYPGSTWRQLK